MEENVAVTRGGDASVGDAAITRDVTRTKTEMKQRSNRDQTETMRRRREKTHPMKRMTLELVFEEVIETMLSDGLSSGTA